MRITPKVGVYYDIPFEEYLDWDAVNHTTLKAGFRSMAHMRHAKQNGVTAPSKAMQFGTLVHAVCLEPSSITKRFVVEPDLTIGITKADGTPTKSPKSTSEYKKRYAEFEKMASGKTIVTIADNERMQGVMASIEADDTAREVLSGGRNEVCIVFVEKSSGILCKARLDKLDLSGKCPRVVDIKTTRDIRRFEKEMLRSGYATQAAFYAEAVASIEGVVPQAFLVVVENEAPYCVRCDYIANSAIEWGMKRFKETLRDYATCLKTDEWPGPNVAPKGWDLPDYAYEDESSSKSWDELEDEVKR